jgi:hypothetical protein
LTSSEEGAWAVSGEGNDNVMASRNKGVGLKSQYHLFDHGEIFQIYMKEIYGDSPVVSEITNLVVVLKGLKMFMETLQINCSVIWGGWSEGGLCRVLIELFLRSQVFSI